MNKPIYTVENISKRFALEDESYLQILEDISFSISAGEIFGIMGESGAGKSTLLNVISTIDVPDSGKVFFKDLDVLRLDAKSVNSFRNSDIGFIYQSHHLLAEFDVLQNVMMPSLISSYGKKNVEEATRLLARVGLSDRLQHSIKKLSGGEQQRVSIARALMNNPQLIFCDEPTGNLDQKNTIQIFELFQSLAKEENVTFVVVSHSELLANYCDQMIHLEDGVIQTKI
jgi:lipoprotein-releasing system ATP-binding protein